VRDQGHPLELANALVLAATVLEALDRLEAAAAAIAEARAALDSCPDPGTLAERIAALERPGRPRRRNGDGALSARELVICVHVTGPDGCAISAASCSCRTTPSTATRSIYRKLVPRGPRRSTSAQLGLI
jgi:hypothetical protein